jgi:hypothetical protein
LDELDRIFIETARRLASGADVAKPQPGRGQG